MGQLLDSAIQFLNEDGWQFTHSEVDNWASLNFTGESGSWLSWFQDRGVVLIAYAMCPTKAPANRRAAVSEFLNRANFGLGVGNFEMSFESGVIRYKSGVHARDEVLSTASAGALFYITNRTMDDYFPAIMSVIYGNTDPELAVARVEEAIELRRNPAALDGSTGAGTPIQDIAAPVVEPISEELAALLASLSSSLDAADPNDDQVSPSPVIPDSSPSTL